MTLINNSETTKTNNSLLLTSTERYTSKYAKAIEYTLMALVVLLECGAIAGCIAEAILQPSLPMIIIFSIILLSLLSGLGLVALLAYMRRKNTTLDKRVADLEQRTSQESSEKVKELERRIDILANDYNGLKLDMGKITS
ncbi:hypothetical protein SBV45_03165 [Chlamydia crocodili]|uniref:hypothetical protein n=1 Tax=Chlamydia TaxID=810 RepID=UPI002FCAC564